MGKQFKIAFLARVLFCLQWLLFLTCKKSYIGQRLEYKPFVILFWHGRLALMPFAFRYFEHKQKKAFVVISQHKDGELITQNIELFGINTIRGSSSKGGANVLRKAFKVLEQNDDVVITPDGPRGPFRSISDGSVLIAQKKNLPIVLLNYEASRYWEFKSWDKMILPKPFSRIRYRISDPIDIKNLELNEAKQIISEKFAIITKEDSF
ncbi:GTP-binding protein [Campylobacter sp. MIT 12-8780]|uniref:lysophospholipid acyltransferase family protein n=1 Tax=unclassified Campylobacter TaxID=2593542 RepID=UPI00115F060A|nr:MULTISPECIES: lysophospholipid acyltransferase family protein [unclassified Campylobacter]NDJ26523.1 lysophospholipid acyltransferase family protein [Campylobacter sp. MIT 19-121]TQR43095.1 GTP-binding protein [Campylobacter sp. MIT 12-8780]